MGSRHRQSAIDAARSGGVGLVGRGKGTATVAEVCETARSLIGVPYRHRGRQPQHSLDCVGVLAVTLRSHDLCSHDLPDYAAWRTDDTLIRELDACLIRAGDDDLEEVLHGFVVGFAIGRHHMHVGVAVPHATGTGMVHACLRRGKVIEHVLDEKWARRLVASWAMPGVEDYAWRQ